MKKINDIPDFQRQFERLKRKTTANAKVKGLNHIKDSFRKGGFTGSAFEPWKRLANPSARAVLINSGFLRDANRAREFKGTQVEFFNEAPYASLHNEGGVLVVRVTKRMRKYFWFMYKKTEDTRWKWMALTKKDRMRIKIPKRKFLGHSEALITALQNDLKNDIQNLFK